MFGGHLPELLIVLVLALVVFGPKRLPEIGGAMGKGIREFRKGTSAGEDDGTPSPTAPAQIPSTSETTASPNETKETEVR